MKNFLKYIWYYVKKVGALLGIQLIITLLGFALVMIQSNIALIIIGILLIIGNGALYFIIGKGAALNDFKYRRINLAKFKGKTPLYESCKEMTVKKAIAVPGLFFLLNLILTVAGVLIYSPWLRAVVSAEFAGIMMLALGTGVTAAINGTSANDPAGTMSAVGKHGLFAAFYLPMIFAICLCYFAGYFISMRTRNRQHNEIKQEIDMFDRMKDNR